MKLFIIYFSDKPGDFTNCRIVLEDMGVEDDVSDQDCANVRYVCQCVSRRAAYLAASGVAVLLNRIDEKHVTVAVDGSVYRFHPHFHNLMVEKISKLINPGLQVNYLGLYVINFRYFALQFECIKFKVKQKKYTNYFIIFTIRFLKTRLKSMF